MSTIVFQPARREIGGITAALERRVLAWLAARTPAWIGSDSLTLLGLASMLGAGLAYARSGAAPAWLHVVNVMLALNWLGDSLDGTLARHRRQERPRYGYYVDHCADVVGILALVLGLAASGYMSGGVAAALLVAYYLTCIQIYLAAHARAVFKISYGWFGGTELRLVLALGNLALLRRPWIDVLGGEFRLFDAGAVVAIAALAAVTVAEMVRNTAALYREERR